MSQTIAVQALNPGGTSSALNVTAAAVIKSTLGTLFRVNVINGGTTGGALTLNDANSLVTAQTITAITAAANAVVTVSTGGSTNPFAVGDTIAFTSVGGMTQINAVAGIVTAIGGVTTAWTITTNINSSAFSAYTSAGTAASFGAANEIAVIPDATTNGTVYDYAWPCKHGIVASSVPTGGIPQYAISYT